MNRLNPEFVTRFRSAFSRVARQIRSVVPLDDDEQNIYISYINCTSRFLFSPHTQSFERILKTNHNCSNPK